MKRVPYELVNQRLKVGQMGSQKTPQRSNKASSLDAALVVPLKRMHGISWLQYLSIISGRHTSPKYEPTYFLGYCVEGKGLEGGIHEFQHGFPRSYH